MARNIESIVMVLGLVVCSIMVLQVSEVSGQASGCPAPVNVTYCPLVSRIILGTACANNPVTMPSVLQILATGASALASVVAGISNAVLLTLGNFLVGLGNALINAVAAGTATTTTAAPAPAPTVGVKITNLWSLFG